ncbi:universal stress protein [Ruegeria faecimaris]|uniref:universal stress protein n=1 Tax=Ruegeria faecimaris TaxID=686389 RepID=UPI00232CC825|nr:universal stress protein [Ruegeria faecimaris]
MYHNILVPISFDDARDMPSALKLAQLLAAPESQVTLLHVVEHIPAYASAYMPVGYLDDARKAVQAELDALAENILGARGVVVEGHSGRTILDWADVNKPDLIIIASHRPGMQDLLLGSTATHVVRHAACSVHVVR